MGRKQKLRRVKQIENQPLVTNSTAKGSRRKKAAWNDDLVAVYEKDFPTSGFFSTAEQLRLRYQSNTTDMNEKQMTEIAILFNRGALEGCIYSMHEMGCILSQQKKTISVAASWLLEGAIRGNVACQVDLMKRIYNGVTPKPPDALKAYWFRMSNKFICSDNPNCVDHDIQLYKDILGRKCAVCGKEDTPTLTLKQCIGCGTCCYCSARCQKVAWVQHNHRGECKQIQILNKYHKPYAKEIRSFSIRGEIHPALEKLRSKLGLTRSKEEYAGLPRHAVAVDHSKYLVAKDDGTVWVGSTPNHIGSPSSDTVVVTN